MTRIQWLSWFSCRLFFSCGEVCVSGSIVDYDYDIHKITPTATDLLCTVFFSLGFGFVSLLLRLSFFFLSLCVLSIWAPNSMVLKHQHIHFTPLQIFFLNSPFFSSCSCLLFHSVRCNLVSLFGVCMPR